MMTKGILYLAFLVTAATACAPIEGSGDPALGSDAGLDEKAAAVGPSAVTCMGSSLATKQALGVGEGLCSPNRSYSFGVRSDGNLVLSTGSQVTWQAGVKGGARLTMQGDGNLVVYGASTALWSTRTAGKTGATLSLQDDGVAVLRYQGAVVWSAGIHDECPQDPNKTEAGKCGCGKAEGTCGSPLKIVWFSVGSADSSLIVFPTGKVMMVDSATESRFADRVLPFMQRHGIKHLDYYAETHPHLDHIGGRNMLKAKGYIDANTKVWDWETHEYGDAFTLEGTNWFIYNVRDSSRYGGDANPNSLSYRIEYNGFVYTSTGDEGVQSQTRFLNQHPNLVRAHVRKMEHHLWGPVSPPFIWATDPVLMVISSVSDVRDENVFKTDFLGAVNRLKANKKRLREYVITQEVGHVILRASSADSFSYDFCPNMGTCVVPSFP